jgi:MFS family permease
LKSRLPDQPFGADFWFAYVANTSLMVAVSAMFRYADYVIYLGGGEYELGWIVGIGMLGALAMRVFQGVAIDRYGAGRIWLASLLVIILSLMLHLAIRDVHSVGVYLARILYTSSLAGAFGASITFVSLRAPRHRTAEVIGGLGSSGFIGMALGPAVADWLFSLPGTRQAQVDRMFLAAALMTGLALLLTVVTTRGESPRPGARRSIPLWWLVRRYHPGAVMLVAVAMGMGIGIPFFFVRPFTMELGLPGIRNFFLVYSGVAFAVRIACRQLPDRWGTKRTVLLGLFCLAGSMLAYLPVRGPWTLILPATLGGIAHAFVFPAVMAGGSLAFPTRYRGLATTLMLTMFDLGMLIGQPLVGSLIHLARTAGWPAYPTMFLTMTIILSIAGLLYGRQSSRRERIRHRSLRSVDSRSDEELELPVTAA